MLLHCFFYHLHSTIRFWEVGWLKGFGRHHLNKTTEFSLQEQTPGRQWDCGLWERGRGKGRPDLCGILMDLEFVPQPRWGTLAPARSNSRASLPWGLYQMFSLLHFFRTFLSPKAALDLLPPQNPFTFLIFGINA